MELKNPDNGENHLSTNLQNPNNGKSFILEQHQNFSEEIDSNCSTPYVSAPSSPGRNPNGYFFSAPASPMHYVLCSSASSLSSSSSAGFVSSSTDLSFSGSTFEFDFSNRFSSNTSVPTGSMSSADELFLNGQIRPMKLSSHLQRPQVLAPLIDLENEEDDEEQEEEEPDFQFVKRVDSMVRGRDLRLHNRSLHRRTRSMSPLRTSPPFQWHEEEENQDDVEDDIKETEIQSIETTPSVSASSSRSSSSGRNSKRWLFLKDFLRSKSEGRGGNQKEKFWYSISFSPGKEKKSSNPIPETKPKKTQFVPIPTKKSGVTGKPENGVAKRRVPPSPHELHYAAKRAQAEEMKKKTFLPYRQGLFGCLGFSSKGYSAVNVFTRSLNPVSSR